MGINADEEILQDFLIEAGEILEKLSEQLIDLENSPEDQELLNSIFRGYHTVKGGAGFLGLTAMVDVCHIGENVFDRLRNGEQVVTPELMDVTLKALDNVNDMFDEVKAGEPPSPAPAELIRQLERYSYSLEDMPSETEAVPDSNVAESGADGQISEDEFDSLLDELHGSAAPGMSPHQAAADSGHGNDDVSEDEFEALLDELHGSGGAPGKKTAAKAVQQPRKTVTGAGSQASASEITEDEFDALLDDLHGKGVPPAGQGGKKAAGSSHKSATGTKKESGEAISDDEFDALLDQLHGVGSGPSTAAEPAKKSGVGVTATAKLKPAAKASAPGVVSKKALSKPASAKAVAGGSSSAVKTPKKATGGSKVSSETTVRVDTRRLDEIMNMVGELVLVRNRMISVGQQYTDERLSKTISSLDVVTGDLQGAVMKTRMQPIKKVFGRFPRVVRDLARNLKKEISLQLVGEETDLDKNLVEALADPLVHLVRNSVDHGIEMPEVREKNGKERVGMIILSATQEGDHILLSIEDDGGGMNPDVLRRIAVEKGLMDQDAADRLTANDCFNLIFMPGFSTKKNVSDISGRGVGMDVVKTRISQLNGSIHVDSELGRGTTINIKVPLTLAILPTLMVTVGSQVFAFPLASVSEIFHLDLTRTNMVDGQLAIIVRERAIPLFYLETWLVDGAHTAGTKREGHVVIFQVGTKRVGFVVDTLIGQEEVVIKPLGRVLQGTPGMAGATITSDGSIALILDVPGLLSHYTRR